MDKHLKITHVSEEENKKGLCIEGVVKNYLQQKFNGTYTCKNKKTRLPVISCLSYITNSRGFRGGGEVVPAIEAATGINLSKEHIKCKLSIKPFISNEAYKYFSGLNFPYLYNSNNERYVKSVNLLDFTPKSLYSSSISSIGERATAYL